MCSSVFLSIIIPCYNVSSYIPKTIDSLRNLEQAPDVEFIFVNDGSTDDTLAIINSFVQTDSRAKIIDQHNMGVSAARNTAISVMRGKYMLCLDGDDYLEPNTISILRANCKDCDVLIAPLYYVYERKRELANCTLKPGLHTIDDLFSKITIFPPSPMLVYKSSIFQDNRLRFNSSIKAGEVLDFTFSFFAHATTINVITYPFYNYVMRPSSATHEPNVEADLSSLFLLHHLNSPYKWAQTSACAYTIYKVINSFTYNKYIRQHCQSKTILQTLSKLFSHQEYNILLHRLIKDPSTPLKDKILIAYQLNMPVCFGFKFLSLATRIIH